MVEQQKSNPTVLTKLFKPSGVAKVLDFLSLYREFDYPKTQISKGSGVTWTTLHRIWPLLEQYMLVVNTRRIGRAKLYKLNVESAIVKALNEFSFQIAKFDARKRTMGQEPLIEETPTKVELEPERSYPEDKTRQMVVAHSLEEYEQV